jgi:hypothetical protein
MEIKVRYCLLKAEYGAQHYLRPRTASSHWYEQYNLNSRTKTGTVGYVMLGGTSLAVVVVYNVSNRSKSKNDDRMSARSKKRSASFCVVRIRAETDCAIMSTSKCTSKGCA